MPSIYFSIPSSLLQIFRPLQLQGWYCLLLFLLYVFVFFGNSWSKAIFWIKWLVLWFILLQLWLQNLFGKNISFLVLMHMCWYFSVTTCWIFFMITLPNFWFGEIHKKTHCLIQPGRQTCYSVRAVGVMMASSTPVSNISV